MIISASRRTDIPAFYSDWFFNRLKDGYVMVRNPMNYHQVSKISLSTDVVDCIVFWTKNPAKMLSKLPLLKDYKYYFQFTLNAYGQELEVNVPNKHEVIQTFRQLSERIGKEKVIWRYDPIFFTDKIDEDYHYKHFDFLAKSLEDYTKKCVISFLDLYKNTKNNLKLVEMTPIASDQAKLIAKNLADIAHSHGLSVESCAEDIDLSDVGIQSGKCIDDNLISEVIGVPITVDKDKTQRAECGCAASIDIGAYNTCNHNCLYCYANFNNKAVEQNCGAHNPESLLLFGGLEPVDKITERKMKSHIIAQTELF